MNDNVAVKPPKRFNERLQQYLSDLILRGMGKALTIHFVDRDIRSRAEAARQALALGHHAEVYSELGELAKYPPRDGLIIARADSATGGVKDIIAALCLMGISLPLVVASEGASVGTVVEAVRAGAIDYLQLPVEQDQLAAVIERTGRSAPAEATARARMIDARRRIAELSEREREVLDLLVDGGSNKRIARELAISPRTVEIHRANMMQKLEAKHVADAVRLFIDAKF